MPDFLIYPCAQPDCKCLSRGIACGTQTNNSTFGICDDPPPLKEPAYIQEFRPIDWIAEVTNISEKRVVFKAIDNCVPVYRPNGELESRCDGLLVCENEIIFIELKDRNSARWLSKGRDQITVTVENFIKNHNQNDYNWKVAYVCNKQRPFAASGINTEMEKFKNDTALLLNNKGLLLKADRIINV